MATTDLSATTTITFEQLTKYFHLPINDVAKELGICATMLKKICRKNGIPRWPHRKIKSLNKMIENLEASLQNNTSEAEECIRQEINILKNKKSLIMKNPSILVQGGSSKRLATDQDGKSFKKLRVSEDDMPVATITIPKTASLGSHSSSSLSINQLLTPSNPFSTPLTSYLLSNEEKDDKKDTPRGEQDLQLVTPARPQSPSEHYYKPLAQPPQSPGRYYLPTHAGNPTEYRRASVEFLTSAANPSFQQPQQSMQSQQSIQPHQSHLSHPSQSQQLPQQSGQQDMHHSYILPKLNFSPNTVQSATSYASPKFRPPSPITSSHQQAPSHFYQYHPQMSTPFTKMYPQPPQQIQQPLQTQQVQPQVYQQPQLLPQQHAQSPPLVLRWVMEYDKQQFKK